jgi:hypothetical protein
MKLKQSISLTFTLILLQVSFSICSAKDSTIVFKIFVGGNCNKWISPKVSDVTIRNDEGVVNCLTVYNHNLPNVSPAIKLSFEKHFKKKYGILLCEKYNYGKISFDELYTYFGYPVYGRPTIHDHSDAAHTIISNQLTTGIGFQINLARSYIVPKLNVSYLNFSETTTINDTRQTIDTTYSVTTSSETIQKSKLNDYSFGLGILAGYKFSIKKIPLFIEIQADYNETQILNRKEWNCFLGIGFKL